MKKKINKLSEKQIKTLKETHEVLSINNDCDLVYEKQIPNAGIALIDGEIELTKKSKILERVSAGNLLGIHYVIHQEPFKFGCKVKKDSKIILIGRSEVLECIKNKESKLFGLIKDLEKDEKTQ
jgi:signal-transduction protein with cAMP-binding, CBS, and nucleotidyltransferase domain